MEQLTPELLCPYLPHGLQMVMQWNEVTNFFNNQI